MPYLQRTLLIVILIFAQLTPLYASSNLVTLSLIIEDDGLPYTELLINNQKVRLLVDTGSSAGLSIAAEYIPHLPGVAKKAGKSNYQNISGETFKAKRYIIKSLVLDGMVFADLGVEEFFDWGVVYARGDQPNAKKTAYQGVIGTGFFAGKLALLDPLHNRLVITLNDNYLPNEYRPVARSNKGSFTFKQGKITVPVLLENVETMAIIDTGANVSLMRPSITQITTMPIESCTVKFDDGLSCARAKAGLTLAGQYLGIHKFYLYDLQGPKEDILIGYDTVSDRQMLLDFSGNTLRVR